MTRPRGRLAVVLGATALLLVVGFAIVPTASGVAMFAYGWAFGVLTILLGMWANPRVAVRGETA